MECPVCTREVRDEELFCSRCGARLDQQRRSQTLEEMAHDFQQRVADEPEDLDARYGLGLALMYQESFEAAVVQLSFVVGRQPDWAEAYEKLAYCLARAGRREEALRAAEKAAELEPGREKTQALLARLRA